LKKSEKNTPEGRPRIVLLDYLMDKKEGENFDWFMFKGAVLY